MIRLIFRYPIFLFIFLIIQCSLNRKQTRTLSHFSSQTIEVAQLSSKEMIAMRKGVIKMNLTRIQLAGQQSGLSWYDDLDEKFDVDTVSIRLKAIEALRSYGRLLKALADEDPQEEINAASERFVTTIKGLPAVQRSLNDSQLSALTKAIQLVGINYIEQRKKKAIQSIINTAKPQIDYLCDKLAAEFDYKRDGKLASQYLLTINNLFFIADDAYFEAKKPERKKQALKAIQLANFHKERKNNYLLNVSQAIQSLKKANAMMQEAFEKDTFDQGNLDTLVQNVRTLEEINTILQE